MMRGTKVIAFCRLGLSVFCLCLLGGCDQPAAIPIPPGTARVGVVGLTTTEVKVTTLPSSSPRTGAGRQASRWHCRRRTSR